MGSNENRDNWQSSKREDDILISSNPQVFGIDGSRLAQASAEKLESKDSEAAKKIGRIATEPDTREHIIGDQDPREYPDPDKKVYDPHSQYTLQPEFEDSPNIPGE